MSSDFIPEQKRYLAGFVAGIQARAGKSFLPPSAVSTAAPEPKPMGPDAPHLLAQDETIKAGTKLVDQEKWKREEHPFDAYHKLRGQAARNEFPKPADNFRWRFYGLFYVAPAQESYMCRLRVPTRPTMWNEFLPISMPITAISPDALLDMACSLKRPPRQNCSSVGREHGRTIPLAEVAPPGRNAGHSARCR
jgi:hypothetical protein